MKPSVPELPNLARSLLKQAIMGLLHAGVITEHDCDILLAILRLEDA
jgi:hypothetical protein